MTKTKIPWATDVWNPTVDCTKVSAGCKNCYAERIFERFHPHEKFTSYVRLFPEKLEQPLHWKKPRRIFVDSMSDLFHPNVPFNFIYRVWKIMAQANWHTFMVLTKRPKTMLQFVKWLAGQDDISIAEFPQNVWIGVSAENQDAADLRIPILLQTPAAVRFVSVEPMLGSVDLRRWMTITAQRDFMLDWVICGCESGPGARPMDLDWARSLRDQCQAAGVPFFLKQAEIDGKLVKMPELDGKIWDEIPEIC